MTRVRSLQGVSLDEALAYLDDASGDEVMAAYALAIDRSAMAGDGDRDPDAMDVHHALFLLRKARGLDAPSYDLLKLHLRQHLAA